MAPRITGVQSTLVYLRRTPPPCNSGIIGIYEGPNIVLAIISSHYCRVGVHLLGGSGGLSKYINNGDN